MKTILASAFSLFAATCAFAVPSHWAAIETTAYGADTAPGTANVADYSAYYCTVSAAERMFGGSSVSAIETYLSTHLEAGQAALAESGVALTSGDYGLGQYQFISYLADAVADGSYIGIAFYGTEAFRVFGNDNADIYDGSLVFDDAASGTVGSWTTATSTVPEPTSGLLILIGLAGLALKRRIAS